MKTLLLIFIFALSLNADSFYNGRCVKDMIISTNYIYVQYSDKTYYNTYAYDINIIDTILKYGKDFYLNEKNYCTLTPTTNYNYLGLTEEQFNISMAFYGIFLSSLIAFGLIKAF